MKKTVLLLIAALLIPAVVTQAQVITIGIEAVVNSVDDSGNFLEGNISVGDLITGSYTYDTSTPDTAAEGAIGSYWHYNAPSGISLSAGGFTFASNPDNLSVLLTIINDSFGQDGYSLRSYNNLALSNGVLVDHIHWQLDDNSGQALSTMDLSTSAPILADWLDGNRLSIRGDKIASYFTIGAHVTSVAVIPEPATIMLFGLGLSLIRKSKHN